MYKYGDVEFAACGIAVLGLILVVAVVSFAVQSRTMFILGSIGSFLGCVIPEPSIHIDGTAEGCFIAGLEFTAAHVLQYGAIGAFTSCVAVAVFQCRKPLGRQYSLRTLLLATTAVAVVLAIFRCLANWHVLR